MTLKEFFWTFSPVTLRTPPFWRRSWKHRVARLGLGGLYCYIGIILVLLCLENRLLYRATIPGQGWIEPPNSISVADLDLTSADGTKLHGWWSTPPGWKPADGAMIFFHGNGGNLSSRGSYIPTFQKHLRTGVLLVDYPGYGLSPGKPSEARLKKSAAADQDTLPPGARARLGVIRFRKGAGIVSIAFAPDGKSLATGTGNIAGAGGITLWDVSSGKEIRSLGSGIGNPRKLVFSADGKTLLASGVVRKDANPRFSALQSLETATGKELRRLESPSLISGGTLAFEADGKSLITVSSDNTIRRWSIATGEEISKYAIAQPSLGLTAVSPDGRFAATGDYEGPVQVWEVTTGRPILAIRRQRSTGLCLKFSQDNRYLALCDAAYGTADRHNNIAIELWELASGKMVHKIPLPPQTGVSAAAFAVDGRRLATGMGDTTAVIWALEPPRSGKNGRQLEAHWVALAADDAVKAYQALGALIDAPGTTAFLKQNFKPAVRPDAKRLEKLLADLDSDEFSVREAAAQDLEKLGDAAAETYRKALEQRPSPERRRRIEKLLSKLERRVVTGEELRSVRAVEVLEHIATPEARQLLQKLADGAPEARLTREAKAALERMKRK